jgi:hypothetical protein
VVDDRVWGEGAPTGGRMTTLSCGNADLELLEYRGIAVAPRPSDARIIDYGFNHVCVDVDDIAVDHATWSTAGMTCFAPWTVMPGGHAAMGYALDVQGTPLELLEHRSARSTMWPGHLELRP